MPKSPHPYSNLGSDKFWKTSVAQRSVFDLEDIYRKKFDLGPRDWIASGGSCFAQHISSHLQASGFQFLDVEPKPDHFPPDLAQRYGYGVYSARYGNIYTARQLKQLLLRATGELTPTDDCWENDGRFFDPFRPTIEPQGYESRDELIACRTNHLKNVVRLFEKTNVFIFTFGLTEAWANKADGIVYPLCPGTAAGQFDPEIYEFKNFGFQENFRDMKEFIQIARSINNRIRFIFTISPVPLVATASNAHVLIATTYSKSVLRAVAGTLAEKFRFVDYFPSYELVAGAPSRSMFFNPDMRTVNGQGVEFVMKHFFKEHEPIARDKAAKELEEVETDPICDEIILEAEIETKSRAFQ